MPRDGAITFGDLVGQVDYLEIACPKCERTGRYSVRRLALTYGRHATVPNWIAELTKDCPRRIAGRFDDQCAVRCPGLLRIV